MVNKADTRRIEVNSSNPERVSVDHLSREMSRVWAEISRQVEQQSGQIPLQTSILTLVVVAKGRLEMRSALDVLHRLSQQLPSRAIVVEIARPGTPSDASISAHCQYLESGRASCYQIIEIRAASDKLNAVPSLLVPLELYDVAKDPGEKSNVAKNNPEVVAKVEAGHCGLARDVATVEVGDQSAPDPEQRRLARRGTARQHHELTRLDM